MRKTQYRPALPKKPRTARSGKSSLRKTLAYVWGRIFCHRNIIIVSDHKTEHLPVSSRLQLGLLAGVLVVVVGTSYSVGNYVAVQQALREKERKIASASLENRRIESEFALLKRDMIQMLDESGKDKKLGEYAQFVVDQYKNGDVEAKDIDMDQLSAEMGGSNAIFQRVAYLEKKVSEMKESHDLVLDSIRSAARGKLAQLETIIKTTGLNMQSLERKAELSDSHTQARRNSSHDPQGGPFVPTEDELLISYDRSLYNDLKRMAILSDVAGNLPLAQPMAAGFKITSGFGVRVDPFRKTLARHTGVDFSGPIGSRILVTSDGTVKKIGRMGAYGNAVVVQHPYGLSTLYGHMSKILVKPGQKLHKGDVVGIQGSTGRSTGNHLHYEVMYNGVKLNPAKFLEAGNHVRKIKDPS